MLFLAALPALAATLLFLGTVRLQPRRSAAKLPVRQRVETGARYPSVTPLPRPPRAQPASRRRAA